MKTNQTNNGLDELLQRYSQNNEEQLNKTPTLADMEHYEEHRSNIEGKSKIIDTWTTIQRENMKMRNDYANKLFWLLAFQLFVVDVILILIGASIIELSDALITATAIKAFVEVIGFIYIIVNYLFKPIDNEIDKLLDKLNKN